MKYVLFAYNVKQVSAGSCNKTDVFFLIVKGTVCQNLKICVIIDAGGP